MKNIICKTLLIFFGPVLLLFCMGVFMQTKAGDIDDKTVVKLTKPKAWQTFSLHCVRLLPGSDFYNAMMIAQRYLKGMDVERMLNPERRQAGLPLVDKIYPGSSQPEGTRPGDLNHYLSGISLMYAQTGDEEFLRRSNYIAKILGDCEAKKESRLAAGDTMVDRRVRNAYKNILDGRLQLDGPDEFGSPWGGLGGLGNFYYTMHKRFAALRDAYLYCNNSQALQLWIKMAEPSTGFVLKVNPDLFDDMLDVEHGGMNEVYADLYALTGDKRYIDVSLRFNHQKVILNIANGRDILYGRHANMQVPTFVGTARQYQLTGDEVSNRATQNFLDIIFRNHQSAIGGNSCYERFGRPGEITKRLGYTSNETCNTYNMLKVALQEFMSTGSTAYMDYFEKALYNHILASQDTESGGVTYYMSLMPGGFKAFSNAYDLTGVWCCVGTGMENHSKYGESIFFHNERDVLVNLFIPSKVQWKEKGLSLSLNTKFPAEDEMALQVDEAGQFVGAIKFRLPRWCITPQLLINGKPAQIVVKDRQIIISHLWRKGDVITLKLPQSFRAEAVTDDANTVAIYHGPVLLAQPLGSDRMPGSDLVRHAHYTYREWVPPTDDIPVLVADKNIVGSWLKPSGEKASSFASFTSADIARTNGRQTSIKLIPYFKLRHQRQNALFKLYSPIEWTQRKAAVSDEINTGNAEDEKMHNLQVNNSDTTRFKDNSNFWENNRIGRFAKDGGSFSYEMKMHTSAEKKYLVVTYWGGEPAGSDFEVLVNGVVIGKEVMNKNFPLTYYEQVYDIPEEANQDKGTATVTFKAAQGKVAGKVYGLLLTSDPQKFKHYLFY